MARFKFRWALTRLALVMLIFLAMQFLSQLGLIRTRNPDCDQLSFGKEHPLMQRKRENVDGRVAVEQTNNPVTLKVDTMKHSGSVGVDASESKETEKLADDLNRLVLELSETRRSLVQSALHYHRVGRSIEEINRIIKYLGGKTKQETRFPAVNTSKDTKQKKEVCPEKFMGKSLAYGYPFFRTGFQRVECSEFVPIHQLVTILMTFPGELSSKDQFDFFEGATKYYPNIRIVLASKEKLSNDTATKFKLNLKHMLFKNLAHGETWSKMLQEVTTPYALVAPEVTHFTDDIDLERLVRVLSNNDKTIIAGGSHRNSLGQWDIGCLQVAFRNWTAFFRGGYYRSFTECVVCDVLSGPFMVKTKELKKLTLDDKLPFGVFHDVFWSLKSEHPEKVVVSCPDVMFNIYSRDIPDERFATLAGKWHVKKWVESNGRVRWYGCKGNYAHDREDSCTFNSGIGVPPCDLENLADAIKFVMKECEDAGLFCELQEGTLLGAVKFSKVLPWERDADITFLTGNYTAFKQLRSKFEAAGYTLYDDDSSLWCCADGRQAGGKFRVGTRRWTLELYGQHMMESEVLVESGQKPTKVQFSGQWVTVMRNPGLFARNRYGPYVYQHAEHWMDMGHDSGWAFYRPSTFQKCPEPGHSACLDQFPADGNLQFSDYPVL
ncbi:uncharacterized protein [Montipora capricornis]|uniref:uncharacterized protein n=1 Tax=Montipora capricornis TaxID=246305 RepID=UPI0035F21265